MVVAMALIAMAIVVMEEIKMVVIVPAVCLWRCVVACVCVRDHKIIQPPVWKSK